MDPLFQDGDLMFDNMIIREIPEIDFLEALRASRLARQLEMQTGFQVLPIE